MLALVTGASSGLGKDFSYLLASKGYNLILSARSKDKLEEIKKDIEQCHNVKVEVVSCDLSSNPDYLIEQTKDKNIDLLINNAGFGDFGEFVDADYRKLENMIKLNIITLTKLTHHYANLMKEKRNGKILNVASIASFQPGPYMANYYATKSYVLSLSEGVDYELKKYRVRVSALCPGPTKTEFFTNAGANQSKVLGITKPLESKKVVAYCYKKMMKGKCVIVPGFKFRLMIFLERLIPRRLVLNIMGKIQEKRKG